MARQSNTASLFEVAIVGAAGYAAWQHPTGRIALLVAGAAAITYVAWWLHNRRTTRPGAGARTGAARTGAVTDLYRLTPAQFEHAIAQLLVQAGWTNVNVSGGAGDLGADITGHLPDGRYGIVQAKRYKPGNNVGSPVVQTMIGMAQVHHRACVGMIVTTSGFTRDARNLGDAHPQFILVDGTDLERPDLHRRLANPTVETARR